MAEGMKTVVVVSNVRSYLRTKDAMMSGELIEALNKKVYSILDDAVVRCKGNKRSTVKPQDI